MIELKIINNSEKNNKKPNTFYKFLYVTYLDYLRGIYKTKIKGIAEKDYTPNYEIWFKAYMENKFWSIIKVDENKSNQQLVLYFSKEPSLYDQFFLRKALKGKKFNQENLKFSFPNSKKPNKSVGNNNININEIIKIGEVEPKSLNTNKSVKQNPNKKNEINNNTLSRTTSKKIKIKLMRICLWISLKKKKAWIDL